MFLLNQKIQYNQFPSTFSSNYKDLDSASLKVGIYFLIHGKSNTEDIINDLSLSEAAVNRAIQFWVDIGLIQSSDALPEDNESCIRRNQHVNHQQMAEMVMIDPDIAILLQESQQILGKELSTSDSRLLMEIYKDYLHSVYAILNIEVFWSSRLNVTKVINETLYTAKDWNDLGLKSEEDYDHQIQIMENNDVYINEVANLLHINVEDLTRKNRKTISKWLNDFNYDKAFVSEVLLRKSDATIPYINSVLKDWYRKGYEKISDTRDHPINIESNNTSNQLSPLFASVLSHTKDE